ncbi:LysR substrate-binding domain-containing protein [Sphingomonas sp. SRS2]|uniref:LysR substrate-binding domain-containing protein n=1 Tax=Sphingomonas sp. SRS2 TaxID=133190 RepID=UPI000A902DD0|nr:LysR substrate-binding domain-containing protein [Sphingomonas sp. SRS2]
MARVLPSLVGLEAFESTARLGSVSRAAEELGLTQGVVSRHIIALEQRLGVALFARRSKRLHLTEAGAAYISEVRAGLEGLKGATTSLMASRGHSGALSVATLPTFGASWLVPRLSRFAARYPDIAITLIGRPEPFDFAFERVDCAIHFGGPEWPGAETDYLCGETMVAVAAPELAGRVRTPEDLLTIPLLHISSRAFAWREWLGSVGAADLTLKPHYTVDTFSMALEAVRAKLAAAILPSFVVEAELARGSLSTIFGPGVESSSAYYFVRPRRDRDHFAVKAFGAWLQLEAGGREADGMGAFPADRLHRPGSDRWSPL